MRFGEVLNCLKEFTTIWFTLKDAPDKVIEGTVLYYMDSYDGKADEKGYEMVIAGPMGETYDAEDVHKAPLIEPFLNKALANVPDDMIPVLAHSFVENAIKNGSMVIFEGNIELEREDLEELQKLLRYNLPINPMDNYQVLTEEPTPVQE